MFVRPSRLRRSFGTSQWQETITRATQSGSQSSSSSQQSSSQAQSYQAQSSQAQSSQVQSSSQVQAPSQVPASQVYLPSGDIIQPGQARAPGQSIVVPERSLRRMAQRIRLPSEPRGPFSTPSPPTPGDTLNNLSQNIFFLRRGWHVRPIQVGTTPVLLIDAVYSAPYLIINPSASISGNQPLLQGDWSAHVIPAPGAAGDNTATPLQTSNYLNLHLFLAFAGTATYSFIFQVLSPSSIAPVFFDVQTLWPGVTGAQALYALVGQMGVGSTIAIRWTLDAPGDGVFLFSYILKEFLGGSASGFPQILYIGSNDAVNTTMGYPIPEGGSFLAVPDAGTQIWGIAQTPIVVNVLEF